MPRRDRRRLRAAARGSVRLLEESGFEVAGQAGDAEDLLRKVGAHQPDVAVVDVRMPPTHTDEGLRAAHRIRARASRARRARALAVRRGGVRARAAVASRRERAATCSRTASPTWTRSPTRVRRVAERRLGARPRGRRAAARPPPARGPAGRAHAARARGARADGRGALQRGDRRGARRDRARRREARHVDLLEARAGADASRTTAACWRCSPTCAPATKSLPAPHRLRGRGPQRQSRGHGGGEQAEERPRRPPSPPASFSGTTSGKPVTPRGTPATATATIAAPAPSAATTVGSISSVDHPGGVAGRAAEQADGRELVAALGRGHRRRVDQRERGERGGEADDQPDAPGPVDVGRVDRVEVLRRGSAARTPGWSAA